MVERKKHEIWAICVLTVTLLIFFSLVSFNSSDLTAFNASEVKRAPKNLVGSFGANVAWSMLFLFGLGSYAIPLAGLWLSWSMFRGNDLLPYGRIQVLGIVLLILSVLCLASIHRPRIFFLNQEIMTGGEIGLALAGFIVRRLYSVGAHILLIGTFTIALLIATPFSVEGSCGTIFSCLASGSRGLSRLVSRRNDAGRKEEARETTPPAPGSKVETEGSPREPELLVEDKPKKVKKEKAPPQVEVLQLPLPAPPKKKAREETALAVLPPVEAGQYATPSLDLLDSYEEDDHGPDVDKLEKNSRVLQEKLADFGVQGKVVAISPGPVITMYEYAPAPGIKISRIVGLSDDLSMALKAISIRVVAPIPGKAAIGIEIPNQRRQLVHIQAVLESEAFASSPSPLTIALGKDITGQPVVANLAKMPHLLIAGATGTGKSVCINTVLSSLLFKNTPDDLRLLLIDPKRIELSSYEGIPQLIHPVVTDAKMATRALRWAVQEMELRYKLLAEKNSRNIEGYNRTIAREKVKEEEAEEQNPEQVIAAPDDSREAQFQHHQLPYIVIIIDELADLMMVASREVEESIMRLAQMARAAGIHLILATQRPSVDVLTGVIKANIPTRISFQVSSRIDSRTILDTSGAESLLGSGDMLFLPPGTAKLQRIHGAFISEAEVQRLTQFWKSQQISADPLRERVNFQDQSATEDISEEELDEKYEEAIQIVMETKQASISMLQRRLRVGYNRAARMIEMMEQQGIVGPSDGIKAREVFGKK